MRVAVKRSLRLQLSSHEVANGCLHRFVLEQDFVHRFAAGSGGVQTADRSAALAWLQSDIARLAFVKGIDDVFIIAAGLTLLGLVPAIFLKRGRGPGRTPGRALE